MAALIYLIDDPACRGAEMPPQAEDSKSAMSCSITVGNVGTTELRVWAGGGQRGPVVACTQRQHDVR